MKLPLADEAEIPKAKIVLYLLNPEHRRGKGKARFFVGRSFCSLGTGPGQSTQRLPGASG